MFCFSLIMNAIILCYPVWAMLQIDKERIFNLYDGINNYWRRLGNYEQLKIDISGENRYNPCHEFTYQAFAMPSSVYFHIESDVKTALYSSIGMTFTVNGYKYCDIPAIIQCTLTTSELTQFNFFLLVAGYNPAKRMMGFVNVYEDGIHDNKIVFTIQEVLDTRIIKLSYTENLEEMRAWYIEQQHHTSDYTNLCHAIRILVDPSSITEPVLNASIIINDDMILVIDNHEIISIPGAVKCTEKSPKKRFPIDFYYIKSKIISRWFKLYDTGKKHGGKKMFELIQAIIMLSTSIKSMNLSERKRILEFYNEYSNYLLDYSEMFIGLNGYNPCYEYTHDHLQPFQGIYTNISSMILQSDTGFQLTLDGLLYFEVPLLIKCTMDRAYGSVYEFLLAISDICKSSNKFKLIQVFKENSHQAYAIRDVLGKEILEKIYTDPRKQSILALWYYEQQCISDHSNTCRALVTLMNPNIENFTIIKGRVDVGKFILVLNATKSVVIPGVIICIFQTHNGTPQLQYFITSDEQNGWFQIFDRAQEENGNRAFSFEEE